MNRRYIYILYGVEAHHLSEDGIKKNFEVFKASHPHPETVTMDYYANVMKELYHSPIDISISREEIAFFVDKFEALECAKKNIGDYNDGGCYNYGLVERLPLGCAYPTTCSDTEYWLFKFVDSYTGYKPISFDTDELTTAIWHKYDLMHSYRNKFEDYQRLIREVESLKDYYGGDNKDVPIHESVIPTLTQILQFVKENNYIYPDLFPYSGGDGAQFEWHMKDVYFEISVDSDGIGLLVVKEHNHKDDNPISKSNITLDEALRLLTIYTETFLALQMQSN